MACPLSRARAWKGWELFTSQPSIHLALDLVGAACDLNRLWQLCHGCRRSTYCSLTRRSFGCRRLARARDQHHGEHRKYRSKNYQSFHIVSCLSRKKLWSLQSIHTELAKLYSKKVISRMVVPRESLGKEVRSIRDALIFKARRDVARVIFISTPHRGSMIAQSPISLFPQRCFNI